MISIPDPDHVFEKSFFPVDAESKYDPLSSLWITRRFPNPKPINRSDAILLDQWISEKVLHYACSDSKAGLEKVLRDLLPFLTLGIEEMSRQIRFHSPERSRLLDLIWGIYIELFSKIVDHLVKSNELRGVLSKKLENQLRDLHCELEESRVLQPKEIEGVIRKLEGDYEEKIQNLTSDIKTEQQKAEILKADLKILKNRYEKWFPQLYRMKPLTKNVLMERASAIFSEKTTKGTMRATNSTTVGTNSTTVATSTGEDQNDLGLAQDLRRLLVSCPDRNAVRNSLEDIHEWFFSFSEVGKVEQHKLLTLKAEVAHNKELINDLRTELEDLKALKEMDNE